LPDEFRRTAIDHYLPLISQIASRKSANDLRLVGINGAQGSGKSTLAHFMQQVMRLVWGWNVVVLSIDDFYLTRAERNQLGASVHPLLTTRGVPGTHDTALLAACLDELLAAVRNSTVSVPRFDKGRDDRASESSWTVVRGPVDLVLLEGWCVASKPQAGEDLERPVNALESAQDASGAWRAHVNEQLIHAYADIFARLDYLVYLEVPDFDAVYRWRVEQERKLGESDSAGDEVMTDDEVRLFIQHYERLTRHNLATMRGIADATLELGRDHQCVASYYR
jgi:D-glycerate 3-kinase